MKKYQIIYADPPWSYQDKKCNGNCETHYNTMNIEDICNLPIKNITDKNCVLFLWTTYPMLQEALRVIKSWGFVYKTIAFQWIKLNRKNGHYFYGLGRWTRGNTEPCLLAVKGRPKRINNSVSQLIVSEIMRHSQKPRNARDKIISLMGDLPRIELFARKEELLFDNPSFKGWDVWGNEVKSDIEF